MIVGWILFFSLVQSSWNYQLQPPGYNPWNDLVEKIVGSHLPGYTTTVQPPTTTEKDLSLIHYITKTIDNIRKEMINGNGTMGMPKMDPWTFEKSKLNME